MKEYQKPEVEIISMTVTESITMGPDIDGGHTSSPFG